MGFESATTVEQALDALGRLGGGARVIAGGTDVMIQRMTGQLPQSETLLYIGRIPDLSGIREVDGIIRIGALTTHRDLRDDPIITTRLPSFAQAAATVGGWQTQAVGTIGGNLCNASPAADLGPPVLAAEATLVVAGPDGLAQIAADRFFVDRRLTALGAGQLLLWIDVPRPPEGTWETYLKVGRRSAMEVALVGLAARFSIVDGVVGSARLAFCSVAPTPIRVRNAEAAVVGTALDDEAVAVAAARAVGAVETIDDQRATASYRRTLVGRLVRKAARIGREALGIA